MNNYEMVIEQGATLERNLTIKDSAGVPIDITGWTFRGQIRKTYSDATVQGEFDYEVKDQITDTGKVRIFIDADDTSDIPVNPAINMNVQPTLYVYDIEAETPTGFVYRVLSGVAKVIPEVTKV
jgi:hypothetical protein